MSEDAERIIPLYEKNARAWAEERGGALELERAWLDHCCERLCPEAHVLDLGCGSGRPIAAALLERGFRVTGVDAAPSLIEIARARFPESPWIIADMRTLVLTQTFDAIVAWHSLFHLTPDDQRGMFPILARHAAPGATIMFTSGPDHGEAIGRYHGEPLYHGSLSPAEYRDLLAANGFTVRMHVQDDEDCGGATVWLAEKTT